MASSCTGNGATKKIAFKKGATCWKYKGTATEFVGKFSRGQNITVQMTGVAEYLGDNGQTTSAMEPRNVTVVGPRGFSADDLDGTGVVKFKAPANGTYTFSFFPCAMQGGMGDVAICAE